MNDTPDLLQIKIETARAELPEETKSAIDAVDWKATITGLRAKKGYTFEQLGDLETETELLLCGLLSPEDYPKELEKRMNISKDDANKLVDELNDLIFKKIREEIIKNIERNKIFSNKTTVIQPEKIPSSTKPIDIPVTSKDILSKAGIEILADQNDESVVSQGGDIKEETKTPLKVKTLLEQKMSTNSFKIPLSETMYSPDNLSKTGGRDPLKDPLIEKHDMPRVDPYRELPQ
jgi:hypothetical protein